MRILFFLTLALGCSKAEVSKRTGSGFNGTQDVEANQQGDQTNDPSDSHSANETIGQVQQGGDLSEHAFKSLAYNRKGGLAYSEYELSFDAQGNVTCDDSFPGSVQNSLTLQEPLLSLVLKALNANVTLVKNEYSVVDEADKGIADGYRHELNILYKDADGKDAKAYPKSEAALYAVYQKINEIGCVAQSAAP